MRRLSAYFPLIWQEDMSEHKREKSILCFSYLNRRGEKIMLAKWCLITISLLTTSLSASAFYREGPIPENYDYLAPDGSEIRLLSEVKGAGLAHCQLPSGKVSQAHTHKTVEEIWHILDGEGQLWRQKGNQEEIVFLSKGMTVTILLNELWQFRCTSDVPLQFIIVTSPPWPGASEAVPVNNHWKSES
jgi:mannose-6-phosphate isomerase-like protein (cupin superfamily)